MLFMPILIMVKTGIGFDVHQLKKGEKLVIGCVKIESLVGSVGHSDGDVLTHAIIDAILGAASLGDIGKFFPSEDIKWKNMESSVFLSTIKEKLSKTSFIISHIDSVIILQEPKLIDYIDEMRKNISSILDIDIAQISIKATTTDYLGYIGKGEGVAAQSVVTLEKNLQ